MYQTLVEAETLMAHLEDTNWVIVDCRFSLSDTEAGRRGYLKSHIPGAVYAHLDDDLSALPSGDSGRHPLPSPPELIELFGRLGIGDGTQVVAYDDVNGTIASRLWWMLRYMGHGSVAVLDGGFTAWTASGYPTEAGVQQNPPAQFHGSPRLDWLASADEAAAASLLVDSRGAERYRGENEPYDPVAGHIPGAVNYFYQLNWTPDGRFMPPGELQANLQDLLGQSAPSETVFYCGSGVSACANLLALAHAGIGDARLYVGSWSGWSSDPARSIATG
jgi:thiosulfate/3-mercaptopyruvate sulfurtransferase